MRKIDSEHRYEYDPNTGTVKDCFGGHIDAQYGVDDFVDELNMLMDKIRELEMKNQELSMEMLQLEIHQNLNS